MAETGLSAAYKAYGVAERALQDEERKVETWSAGLQDVGGALVAAGGLLEDKIADDLSFEGGKKLLEKQGGEYMPDIKEASLSPFSWGKQEGVKYDGKTYDRQQVITLGEASLGSSLWFDEETSKKLVKHWSGRYGDEGSALIDNTATEVSKKITSENSEIKSTGGYNEQGQQFENVTPTKEEHEAGYVDPNTYEKPAIGSEPGLDRIYNAYWMNEHGYRLMGVDDKTVWQLPIKGWTK